MKRPSFLSLDEVFALHADQFERAGVRPAFAIAASSSRRWQRRRRALEVELPSLPEMAAATLVQNHPMLDGNKRLSLAAVIAFLGLSDLWLAAAEDDVVALVLRVASGLAGKPAVVAFVRGLVEELGAQ